MLDSICKVRDCGRKKCSLGYCSTHYKRFREYGNPIASVPIGAGHGRLASYVRNLNNLGYKDDCSNLECSNEVKDPGSDFCEDYDPKTKKCTKRGGSKKDLEDSENLTEGSFKIGYWRSFIDAPRSEGPFPVKINGDSDYKAFVVRFGVRFTLLCEHVKGVKKYPHSSKRTHVCVRCGELMTEHTTFKYKGFQWTNTLSHYIFKHHILPDHPLFFSRVFNDTLRYFPLRPHESELLKLLSKSKPHKKLAKCAQSTIKMLKIKFHL